MIIKSITESIPSFDPFKQTCIQVVESGDGVGYLLIQKTRLV